MRILIVISTGIDQFGGLTNAILNFIKEMDRSEMCISFASYTTNTTPQESLLRELNDMGCTFIPLPDRNKRPIKYMAKVYEAAKQFDCIHVNSNSATAVLELLPAYFAGINKRIVHNHTAECDHYRIHKILYPVFKRLFTKAVAVSDKAGEWIFGKGCFLVLKNGINVGNYGYSEKTRILTRNAVGIPQEAKVIGHLGKIYEPKNHKFIIRVFNEILKESDNTFLLLVGDGELRPEIEKQVNEKGLQDRVIFAGMQRDVKGFLDAMDVFIFPSLWEGLPISLLEAQASGLPCVISDRIDSEVCASNLVKRLSLDAPIELWKETIIQMFKCNRENNIEYCFDCLRKSGFDTKISANLLRELYLN